MPFPSYIHAHINRCSYHDHSSAAHVPNADCLGAVRVTDKIRKPPIQDAVEKATSDMLLQPDWDNNLIICDAIDQKQDL